MPSSAETGGTNYLAPGGLSGELLSLTFLAIRRPPEMTGGMEVAFCHPSWSGINSHFYVHETGCIRDDSVALQLILLGHRSGSVGASRRAGVGPRFVVIVKQLPT